MVVHPNDRTAAMEHWLRHHIEPAIDRGNGRISIDEVLRKWDSFEFQIWLSVQGGSIIGAAVTHVLRWGSGRKSLSLILAGGKWAMHKNIEPTMAALEDFAKKSGCRSVMVEGRKGWERALPDGYEFSHAVFEKEIA